MGGATAARMGMFNPAAGGDPITVGETTNNGNGGSMSINRLRVSQATAASDCDLDEMHFIADETDGAALIRLVIYSDNGANAPDTLLGQTAEQSGITDETQYDLALTATVSLTAGQKVWIGPHTGGSASIIKSLSGASIGRSATSNSDTYADGPPAAWPGSASTSTAFIYTVWASGVET